MGSAAYECIHVTFAIGGKKSQDNPSWKEYFRISIYSDFISEMASWRPKDQNQWKNRNDLINLKAKGAVILKSRCWVVLPYPATASIVTDPSLFD